MQLTFGNKYDIIRIYWRYCMSKEIEQLQKMIDESNNIVFLGGAGTSTDSGLPDFRGDTGLYSKEQKKKFKRSPEQMLSHNFYVEHPAEFFDFYRECMLFDWAKPSALHFKLAEMEQKGKLKAVITQNIDNLHQKGGSKNVIELHGSSAINICRKCGKVYDETVIRNSSGIPRCECGGIIKPDVVLYGENLNAKKLADAENAVEKADMLIIGGTSLTVYPVAGLPDYFTGKYMVIINNQPTNRDSYADLVLHGNITEIFNQITL